MDEVTGILIAVVALFLGLLALGWAYGDFQRSPRRATPPEPPQQSPPA